MRTVYTEVLAYTLRVMNLCIWVVVTEFPSSGEKGCPTGGVVAANIPIFTLQSIVTRWRNKVNVHFILSLSHTALRGGISPSLSGDISALARRYLRLCPQISPPTAYHAPVNSANGWNLILQMQMTLIYNL